MLENGKIMVEARGDTDVQTVANTLVVERDN